MPPTFLVPISARLAPVGKPRCWIRTHMCLAVKAHQFVNHGLPWIAVASFLVACADESGNRTSTNSTIERFDTIKSAAVSAIALVSDLAVAPDGTLWIVDRGNSNLVSITPD